MKILSVVCARAGSKGIENKCIARIGQKMVVEYSIEYSRSLGPGVKTVVSTDIEDLISYCVKNGIPFVRRDKCICADNSRIEDALADAIEREGQDHDYCSLVYGNIPTRYPRIFHDAALFLNGHTDYDAAISMQDVGKYHPEWMCDYSEDVLVATDGSRCRRQDLPPKMIHDGHTLIFKIKEFYAKCRGTVKYDASRRYSMFGNKIKPLINEEAVIDIDTRKDMRLAEGFLAK
jgi:CMP-N-acetylneuraminic acid synthetase